MPTRSSGNPPNPLTGMPDTASLALRAAAANPFAGMNAAANRGSDALQPGLVDQAVTGQMPNPFSQFGMMPLQPPPAAGLSGSPFSPVPATPSGGVQDQQQPILAYSPSRNEFMVNNAVFSGQDLQALQQVPQFLEQPRTEPLPPGDWQMTSLEAIAEHAMNLETLSAGERLRLGTREAVGSIVSGVGRGAEMLGAEGVGGRLVGAGQRIGPSEEDQFRQQAVYESNTLLQNMFGAVPQGAPSFGISIAGGVAGFALGGPIGAIIGSAATIFPMMLDSAYNTAEQQFGPEFVQSTEGRVQVASTGVATSVVQTIAPAMVASRLFGSTLFSLTRDGAARSLTSRVTRSGAVISMTEAAAEGTAYMMEQVMFDPQVRAALSGEEVEALLPYLIEQYGEGAVISTFAGGVLGGAAGVAAGVPSPRGAATPSPDVDPLALPAPPRDFVLGEYTGPEGQPPAAPAAPQALPSPQQFPQVVGKQEGYDAQRTAQQQATRRANQDQQGRYTVEERNGKWFVIRTPQEAAAPAPAPAPTPAPESAAALPAVVPTPVAEPTAPAAPLSPEPAVAAAPAVGVPPTPPAEPPLSPADLEDRVPLGDALPAEPTAAPEPAPVQQTRQELLDELTTIQNQPEYSDVDLLTITAGMDDAQLQQHVARYTQELATRRAAPEPAPVEPTPTPEPAVAAPAEPVALNRVRRADDYDQTGNHMVEMADGTQIPIMYERGGGSTPAGWYYDTRPDAQPVPFTSPGFGSEVDITDADTGRGVRRAANAVARAYNEGTIPDAAIVQRATEAEVAPEPTPAPTEAEAAPEPTPAPTEAAPEPTPAAPQLFGTKDGNPFKNKGAARLQVGNVARREGIPADQLQEIQTPDGWFVGRKTDADEIASPEAVPTRDEPTARQEVREEDTQREEAAQAREEVEAEAETPVVSSKLARDAEMPLKDQLEYAAREVDLMDIAANQVSKDIFSLLNTETTSAAEAAAQNDLARAVQEYYDNLADAGSFASDLIDYLESDGVSIANLTPAMDAVAESTQVKQVYDPVATNRVAKPAKTEGKRSEDAKSKGVEVTPEMRIANQFLDYRAIYNAGQTQLAPSEIAARRKRINKLWKDISAERKAEAIDSTDTPLQSYFDEKGKVKLHPLTGLPLTIAEPTRAQALQAKRDAEQAAKDFEKAAKERTKTEVPVRTLDEANATLAGNRPADPAKDQTYDGNYMRADGKAANPLPVGRVRMLANALMRKFTVKPKLIVVRDREQFIRNHFPDYEKAKAARPQGDFDSTEAAGYSYRDGDTSVVVLFTDYIPTEQTVRFLVAHEALGHFGFRSIMSQQDLARALNKAYEDSPGIRQLADENMLTENMGKLEAIEEALADMAASLDSNILRQLWASLKTGVEKLTGIKFEDYAARHLIQQARRYVRNGNVGTQYVDYMNIVRSIQRVDSGADLEGTGRFMRKVSDLYDDNKMAGAMNLMSDMLGEGIDSKTLVKDIKQMGINIKERVPRNFRTALDQFSKNFFGLQVFTMRENQGSFRALEIIRGGHDLSMKIRVATKEMMAPVLSRGIGGRFLGITTQQYNQVNEALYSGMFKALSTFDPSKMPTLEKLAKVVENPTTGEIRVELNESMIDALYKQGRLSFQEMKNGFTWEQVLPSGEVVTERFAGIKDMKDENDVRWKGYEQTRQAIRYVWTELVRAKYSAYVTNRNMSYAEIAEYAKNKKLRQKDTQFLNTIYNKYYQLYTAGRSIDPVSKAEVLSQESMQNAADFIALANKVIIAKDPTVDLSASERDAFAGYFPKEANIVSRLDDFRTVFTAPPEGPNRFVVQNNMVNMINEQISAIDSDSRMFAQTLATGYVPLRRRGNWQVRMEVRNKDGNIVRLQEDYATMLAYRQFESEGEAVQMMNLMNKEIFTDYQQVVDGEVVSGQTAKYAKVMAWDADQSAFVETEVTINAVAEPVLTEVAGPPELNLNEFVRGLRHFSINLHPEKMQQVIIGLTKQNSAARARLQRRGLAGYDPDAVRGISEFIESMASNIGKTAMRPKLNELMNMNLSRSQRLWNMDERRLNELRQDWERVRDDPNASQQLKMETKRAYNEYAFRYKKTRPEPGVNKSNEYRNRAANLISFLENARQLEESNLEAGKYISGLRALTTIVQLGASPATGALNYIGMWLNGTAVLASYNEKNNFGGGFGFGKSTTAIHQALVDIGMTKAWMNPELNTAEFYDSMIEANAKSPQDKKKARDLKKKYNLNDHEAAFIAEQIREGRMIPAQSNALTATARGRITSGALQKLMDSWMFTFNTTEQGSRRGLGLAAYRLQFDRSFVAIKEQNPSISDADATQLASKLAAEFSVDVMDTTVGQYSVINRPPFWRGGLPALLYIYKVFPTTSIQLLARLPRSAKVGYLFALWTLAGLRGFPFAEDLEDIFDTIAMKLGFSTMGARAEIGKIVETIAPGMSPVVFRGLVSSFLPMDVQSRTSLGNFAPGTDYFLPGANRFNAVQDIGGPMVGMLSGFSQFVPDTLRALAGDERVTLNDAIRNSPVTMMRAFGDAYAYTSTGAIVDRRGYTLSPDVSALTILGRLTGWYPTAAATQYDIIRYSQRIMNYQREVSGSYRTAWVNAMARGDTDRARAIEQAVIAWNEANKGTALEIRNFRQNARRALRESARPGVDRYLRTVPNAARQDVMMIEQLLGF